MAWKTINRQESVVDADAPSALSEAVREKIRSFFPRYETKRAVLLPALWIVQNTNGHVSHQAMVEIADLLEIHPSDVLDTLSFYTHFWTHPKGKKVVTVCRSLSCELMGGADVLAEVKKQLGIDEHGTSADGQYSLVTEECLACCDHAPCMIINEKTHKHLRPADVAGILADESNDRLAIPRSDLFDAPLGAVEGSGESASVDRVIGSTSDVDEMRDAD
ncbi:MAG: NAD(P)H-dependent oxidoreductase subunit E [Planctomycetes bacterium]|nr:NAD(P)H-dependent oxidoreductase subunit E [Planctomycetota bacterium]